MFNADIYIYMYMFSYFKQSKNVCGFERIGIFYLKPCLKQDGKIFKITKKLLKNEMNEKVFI